MTGTEITQYTQKAREMLLKEDKELLADNLQTIKELQAENLDLQAEIKTLEEKLSS